MRNSTLAAVLLCIAICGCSTGEDNSQQADDLSAIHDVAAADHVQSDTLPQEVPLDPGNCTGTGCPCSTPSDCPGGNCVETNDGNICVYHPCTNIPCPRGTKCDWNPSGDVECVLRADNLCRPCNSDSECMSFSYGTMPGARCIPSGPDGSFCGWDCATDEDCPEGYTCREAVTLDGSTANQCRPEGDVCPCTDRYRHLQYTTTCYRQNEFGECAAQRTCDIDCPAREPKQETCNMIDDDCDGLVDNGEGLCQQGQACVSGSCITWAD